MKLTNQQIENLADKASKKAIAYIQEELCVKSNNVYDSFSRTTDAMFRVKIVLSDYIAKEIQEGNATEKKAKVVVTKAEIDQLYWDSCGAYSQDNYKSWRAVCAMMLRRGYTATESDFILRSKFTRWACDRSGKRYGQNTAKDFERYLDHVGPDEIKSLFNER